MKTLAELRDFYERELVPAIGPFERQRRRALVRSGIAAAVMLALAAAALALGAAAAGPIGVIIVLAVSGAAVVLVGYLSLRGYKRGFKREVVGRVVKFLDPGLSYSPAGRVPEGWFRASRLFEHRIDRYRGEDCVEGRLGGTEVRFSEVHAEYRSSSGGKGSKSQWNTLFKGLFFAADFNKKFRGKTVVVPDVAEQLLGGWLGRLVQSMNFTRTGELVKLENPDFEKYFAVYADDQVEARYILTPSLMERLVEFRELPETGDRVFISFAHSRVHVAVPLQRDMFEPRIFGTLLDFAVVREYYLDLTLAAGIVEDLDLNTRIWTKE